MKARIVLFLTSPFTLHSSHFDALFPDSFEHQNGELIPSGWSIGPILEQADLLSGGTPKTSVAEYWGGEIPWASAKDVSQCGEAFLIRTERTITQVGLDKSSTKIIEPLSTVVVARGATTGRLTMFGQPIAMNQTCYALRSKHDTHLFLYCHAREFSESRNESRNHCAIHYGNPRRSPPSATCCCPSSVIFSKETPNESNH